MPIPSEISEIWEFLNSEITWLHGRWNVYRQIYGTNPERIELINWAAPTFFFFIERVLINDVQLTLIKLADPARTCGRDNATLEALVVLLENHCADAPIPALRSSLIEYRNRCKSILHRRHKDLAHFDLSVQLGNKAEVLPGPSRQEIEDALKALRQFMNLLFAHYKDTQMGYEHFSLHTDGNTLLYQLQRAHRYEQLEELGTIPFDDITKSSYFSI